MSDASGAVLFPKTHRDTEFRTEGEHEEVPGNRNHPYLMLISCLPAICRSRAARSPSRVGPVLRPDHARLRRGEPGLRLLRVCAYHRSAHEADPGRLRPRRRRILHQERGFQDLDLRDPPGPHLFRRRNAHHRGGFLLRGDPAHRPRAGDMAMLPSSGSIPTSTTTAPRRIDQVGVKLDR